MPLKQTTARQRSSSFLLAVSYRLPLPVTKVLQLTNGTSYPVCPRCQSTMDREYMNFCDRCGQKLLWDIVEFADVNDNPQKK